MFDYKKIIKKMSFKEIIASTLIFTLLTGVGYSFMEPVLAEAVTDSVVITLNVSPEITITDEGNKTMTPPLSLTNDTAVASSTWSVTTNDKDGYALTVQATSTPAMQSATDQIADYTVAIPDTPEAWAVASGAAEFGFSAYGADVPTGTWGSGTTCGTTGPIVGATRLYRGFNGATPIQIAISGATTSPSGTPATVCYAVEQDNVSIPSGTYTATITATALVR